MTDNTVVSLNTPQDPLTELIRQGARDLIAQAVEAELQQLLAQHQNVMVDGKQAIVRNGFLPERTLQTGVGDVEVQLPKVRDRSGNGVKFNSNLISPYLKRTKSVATLLPLLYLKGISTGDMLPALESLLGKDAKGLSTNSICRLKEHWYAEYEQWRKRDLGKFGQTVFTVTLGWTISSAYSSSWVSMTLDAKKSLAFWMVTENQKQVGQNSLSSYEHRDYS